MRDGSESAVEDEPNGPGNHLQPRLTRPASPQGLDPATLWTVHESTRSLLHAATADDIVGVVLDLVRDLGGRVVAAQDVGPGALPADILPMDLTFGLRDALFAAAPDASIARLNLETALPTFVEDARRCVMDRRHAAQLAARVGRTPSGRGPRQEQAVEAYLDLVASGSGDEAVALVLAEQEADRPVADVILGLLAPAQREAGERWHDGNWTTAEEHLLSATTDSALHHLMSAAPRPAPRGALAVVCAPGDWHTLASRMAAELLRLHGWQVVFLGGSLPTPDLARWVGQARPDALVVTCSLPTHIRGVLDIARAVEQLDVPVVAGGSGLGLGGRRAAAMGVRWTDDLSTVEQVLSRPPTQVDRRALADRIALDDEATTARADIVDLAVRLLHHQGTAKQQLTGTDLAAGGESLGPLFDAVAAAALTRDGGLLTDHLHWLDRLLTTQGRPPRSVALCLDALALAMPVDLEPATALVTAERRRHPSG